jgi:hypothetical protein
MRLLLCNEDGDLAFTKNLVGRDEIPSYAILSHTWGEDTDEITFDDVRNGTGKNKPGYRKVQLCGEQARKDGLGYFWVDTCCINKADNTELSEAVTSMFRWYSNATRCYVYLSDVLSSAFNANEESGTRLWESDFRNSRWFKRGWTLQELLAPSSVEFFSKKWKRLGDKNSLRRQIQVITKIADSALQQTPLSQFSVDERLSWMEDRQTKLDEDRAYSLLGIFDVSMPLIYGEGEKKAFNRLRDEINKPSKLDKENRECILDLRLTDPRDDKKRIEETKGGLLEDSYHWIVEHSDFQQWRDNPLSRLLWIKGDPGKGKTMLLCGIIDELNQPMAKTNVLSYFFCQATDSRINTATSVLRGLVYLLIVQQPLHLSYIREKYDHAGKALFEDANAWVALSEIFRNILRDPSLTNTYLIVDALDECVVGLPKLLGLIIQQSSQSSRVKWIVSSRNRPDIEEQFRRAENEVRLCLELNTESVSTAVGIYIRHKVLQLTQQKNYNNKTRDAVLDYLSRNANDTFLWVALVCQNLEDVPRWNTLRKLNEFPSGLDSFYERMLARMRNSEHADICKHILALIVISYRPITLNELTSLIEMREDISDDLESVREIVGLCGSFLTIREYTVYFVHQSAKDFLLTKASDEIFPAGREAVHYEILSRSIQIMSRTLHRDMYGLRAFGYPIKRVEQPVRDPLTASRYSCIYWIDHLCDCSPNYGADGKVNLQDGGMVEVFLREKYLYWLEALSLCRNMSAGLVSMARLEAFIQVIDSLVITI